MLEFDPSLSKSLSSPSIDSRSSLPLKLDALLKRLSPRARSSAAALIQELHVTHEVRVPSQDPTSEQAYCRVLSLFTRATTCLLNSSCCPAELHALIRSLSQDPFLSNGAREKLSAFLLSFQKPEAAFEIFISLARESLSSPQLCRGYLEDALATGVDDHQVLRLAAELEVHLPQDTETSFTEEDHDQEELAHPDRNQEAEPHQFLRENTAPGLQHSPPRFLRTPCSSKLVLDTASPASFLAALFDEFHDTKEPGAVNICNADDQLLAAFFTHNSRVSCPWLHKTNPPFSEDAPAQSAEALASSLFALISEHKGAEIFASFHPQPFDDRFSLSMEEILLSFHRILKPEPTTRAGEFFRELGPHAQEGWLFALEHSSSPLPCLPLFSLRRKTIESADTLHRLSDLATAFLEQLQSFPPKSLATTPQSIHQIGDDYGFHAFLHDDELAILKLENRFLGITLRLAKQLSSGP